MNELLKPLDLIYEIRDHYFRRNIMILHCYNKNRTGFNSLFIFEFNKMYL